MPQVRVVARPRLVPDPEPVLGAQPVDEPPHRLRQSRVRRRQVGPRGVAAVRGYGLGAQDGRGRRVDPGAVVAVPAPQQGVAAPLQPLGVVHAVPAAQLQPVGRRLHLREPLRRRAAALPQRHRLTEPPRERDMARVIQPLPPEEHHLPAQHSRPDHRDHRVVQRPGRQVHPGDLRADQPRDRLHLDAFDTIDAFDSVICRHLRSVDRESDPVERIMDRRQAFRTGRVTPTKRGSAGQGAAVG